MKINKVAGMLGAYHQNSARRVAGAKETSRPERSDEIRLSKEAQEVMNLKDKLAQAPDIRRERIEELRREISAGTYRPSGRDIASKMLKARVFEDLM